ncbi:MAG: type I-F CRISPR-associated protein Csy2 [Proteobacteria bacterium]|nr:type I-F CRISPR-associated protein Csy2 [Pseudomonadota bacterium]
MTESVALLILPHLRVQNANAVSGPLTWGFPSPTAFTGFAHAIQRRFSNELNTGIGGVGIVCHRFDPQVTKPPGRHTRVFNLTRNPIKPNGKPASFFEEGRAHMEITLLIAVHDFMTLRTGEQFARDIMQAVEGMRLAGGAILPTRPGLRFQGMWLPLADDTEGQSEQFRKLRRTLLPGFALVQREDVLAAHMDELREKRPRANALDALLDLSRLNFEPDLPDPDRPGEIMWGIRAKPGWQVPLPVGYAALSEPYEPGRVKNTRDDSTPFRFVECLYSLGEWVSPHRVTNLEQLLWHRVTKPDQGLYLCVNHYSNHRTTASTGA